MSEQPCTLRDFLNYLKYIEHNAENLQFFLWHKSYLKRFEDLPAGDKVLAPVWTETMAAAGPGATVHQAVKVSAATAAVLRGTALDPMRKEPLVFSKSVDDGPDPFVTPPPSSGGESDSRPSEYSSSVTTGKRSGLSASGDVHKDAEAAYDDSGLKWKPFTIQPFRDEIARIVTIYIAEGSPRQLNLSAKERHNLLHALENTTHPSAFAGVLRTVEWSLRFQAHPNFIRWTICNGNPPRVTFARGLGIGGIVAGILVALLITLSDVGRGWRALALIPFFIGIATLIAAWKGMCVVLHGMHHRHLRPWELFQDEDEEAIEMKKPSFDSMDTGTTSNSYEDEPWIAKYQKRMWVRKVFDRELWVEEPALRQIQDTIFVQSLLGALVGGGILTAIFVAVPKGGFF